MHQDENSKENSVKCFKMRILSWNINGLRSLKGDLNERLKSLKADIICVQETKVTRDMLEECHAILPDFTSYFAFSRKRSGYSGVAIYCAANATPYDAKEGIAGSVSDYDSESQSRVGEEFSAEELKELDAEGRAVVTWHKSDGGKRSLVVINVYCPRADPERRDRLLYKMKFYKLLEMRADALLRAGHSVIIVGDVNTSHKQIDHCDPYEDFESQPGRQWMDHFLYTPGTDARNKSNEVNKKDKNDDEDDDDLSEWKATTVNLSGGQFIDAFRCHHPDREEAFTCWNTKLNCRSTNYGTRIDYVFVDRALAAESLSECDIHPDVEDSDHCPVSAELSVTLLPSQKCPQYCTKNFPEFSGRQQKVSKFFAKRSSDAKVPSGALPPPSKKPKQQTMLNFFQSKAAKTVSESPVVEDNRSTEEEVNGEQIEKRVATASAWKSLFKGPPPAPNCRGHNDPAVLRTVKKKGPNSGKQFWCCSRGEGKADDPNARCDFFKWVK